MIINLIVRLARRRVMNLNLERCDIQVYIAECEAIGLDDSWNQAVNRLALSFNEVKTEFWRSFYSELHK